MADRTLEAAAEINARLLSLRERAPRRPANAAETRTPGDVVHRVAERLASVSTVSREARDFGAFLSALSESLREMRRRAARRGISPDGDIMEALLWWEVDEASEGLDAWQRSSDRLLIITGNKGAGKSSLGARAMMRHPYFSDGEEAPPYIITAHALAEALARPYDEPRKAIVRRVSSLRLIVIDDFGSVALDEEQSQKMIDYLCRALATGVRVIVTSNEGLPALQNLLFRDGRLRDRAQLGMTAMHLSGGSRRTAKAAAKAKARSAHRSDPSGRRGGGA